MWLLVWAVYGIPVYLYVCIYVHFLCFFFYGSFPCSVISSYSALFVCALLLHFIVIPYRPVCFLTRNRKGIDLERRGGREELRGVGGGDIIIRMHCMGKKSIFNERK